MTCLVRSVGWVRSWCILLMLLMPGLAAAAAPLSLYFFVPSNLRSHELEKLLRKSLPGVEVTVFGRVADFKTALETTPPDAVIALRPVLEEFALKPELQGMLGTEDSEAYVVLSTETGLTREGLAGKVVGTVDLLGHKKMGAFVSMLLGVGGPVKIQSVTKAEDLLPLLQFKSADVVLVPESALSGIKSRSRMDFQTLKLESARVGRAAVAFPVAEHRAQMEQQISAMPREIGEAFGVGSWRKN